MKNRERGVRYELKIKKELEELGISLVTSRSESRSMDNKGVDLFDPDNKFPYFIQCKTSSSSLNYVKLFQNILPNPLLLFINRTKKSKKNFISQGEFVIMEKETFYEIIKKRIDGDNK